MLFGNGALKVRSDTKIPPKLLKLKKQRKQQNLEC